MVRRVPRITLYSFIAVIRGQCSVQRSPFCITARIGSARSPQWSFLAGNNPLARCFSVLNKKRTDADRAAIFSLCHDLSTCCMMTPIAHHSSERTREKQAKKEKKARCIRSCKKGVNNYRSQKERRFFLSFLQCALKSGRCNARKWKRKEKKSFGIFWG